MGLVALCLAFQSRRTDHSFDAGPQETQRKKVFLFVGACSHALVESDGSTYTHPVVASRLALPCDAEPYPALVESGDSTYWTVKRISVGCR